MSLTLRCLHGFDLASQNATPLSAFTHCFCRLLLIQRVHYIRQIRDTSNVPPFPWSAFLGVLILGSAKVKKEQDCHILCSHDPFRPNLLPHSAVTATSAHRKICQLPVKQCILAWEHRRSDFSLFSNYNTKPAAQSNITDTEGQQQY